MFGLRARGRHPWIFENLLLAESRAVPKVFTAVAVNSASKARPTWTVEGHFRGSSLLDALGVGDLRDDDDQRERNPERDADRDDAVDRETERRRL